ncbi:MAG: cadherin-like beta sandwich domain-containing protein [Deltaproteobacteria bacterium]|nr:cadherin-like beta sandwich domain-containing protein [Deltaproteobacteria bacterium]
MKRTVPAWVACVACLFVLLGLLGCDDGETTDGTGGATASGTGGTTSGTGGGGMGGTTSGTGGSTSGGGNVPTYTLGGTVTGLTDQVTLSSSHEEHTVSSDGGFTFPTALADSTSYDVTVTNQPTGQLCVVTNGTGQIAGANVTDVQVDCGSANADLSALDVACGTLTPAFSPSVTTYALEVSALATTVRVTPTVADAGATVTVDGFVVPSGTPSSPIFVGPGPSAILVEVTAESSSTQTYTLNVTLASALESMPDYVKASNTNAQDGFGYDLGLADNTAVVGAPGESSGATGVNGNEADNSATSAGAAYVVVRDGCTGGTQEAYLKASNAEAYDSFGTSVAISGDTIVIGAPGEDSNATGANGNESSNVLGMAGAAYVFVRSGTTWTQQAYLKASNPNVNDRFGTSVAISADTIVVGAFQEDSSATGINGTETDNTAADSGAAYVFVRNGTTWTQQAYLKASNTDPDDQFGRRVGIDVDTIVVGAHQEDSAMGGVQVNNTAAHAGAAYVFVRNGTTWSQQAYLKASNIDTGDQFGTSVAVHLSTIAIGANFEDSNALGVNGAETDNSATGAGAAYVFVRNGSTWSQQAYIKASNTDSNDQLGVDVALFQDKLIVGANREDSNATGVDGDGNNNSAQVSGAAYLLVRSGSTWAQLGYLKASNTGADDYFGLSVAISAGAAMVGANLEDSNATGLNGNDADNSATGAGATYLYR